MHIKHEYDYRFKTAQFRDVVRVLEGAYQNATGDALEVQEVGDVDSLAKNMMTKVRPPPSTCSMPQDKAHLNPPPHTMRPPDDLLAAAH